MVGHILEYHPAVALLKDIVQRGELGRVLYLYSNRLNLGKVRQTIAFLLDYAPQTWCSRDDHYLRLAEALMARGVKLILVFGKEPLDAVSVPLRSCGAEVAAIDYSKGIAHYYR